MEPKLLNIYHKYYQESEKSFIELIELIKKVGIDKVEAAIAELEKLNPKVVTICQRVDFPRKDKIIKQDCPIEQASRQTLHLYDQLLKGDKSSLTEEDK